MRYEMNIPITTGTAGATSLFCVPVPAPARTPATAGATSAIAPMVAIQPPSTDIQEVAGRTTTLFTITLLQEKFGAWSCKTLASPSPGGRLGERCLRAGRLCEGLGEVRVLPWQVRPAEVAVRGRLPIDRAAQPEALDDRARSEVEVLLDELADGFVGDRARAEGLHVERDGVRTTDDVRELQLEAVRETRFDDVLRDVARRVGGGAVDLRRVLTAERAATVSRVAAVGVDDDLAPGEPGVAHRPADGEGPGPVHEVLRFVEPRVADRRPDDLLADLVAQALVVDAGIVLRGDDHGVDALRHALLVLDRDLGLPVGPKVRKRPVLARFRQLTRDSMRQGDRERHELGRFADGEAEHHSLIPGAEFHGVDPFTRLDGLVDALRDLRRLLFDRSEDAAGAVIETVVGVRVADVLHDAAHEPGHIDVRMRGDLARDEDDAGGRRGLARDARVGILAE